MFFQKKENKLHRTSNPKQIIQVFPKNINQNMSIMWTQYGKRGGWF